MSSINGHRELFLRKLPQLSKNQKKVAEYLMEHPQEMALSSITDIARHLNVAQATIVRLAKALGYSGYLEMKNEMLQRLRENLTPVERFQTELNYEPGKDDVLVNVAQEEVKNINITLRLIDQNAFRAAVELISTCRHIYTFGLGISAFVSQIAAYVLNRITLKASALSHGSVSFIEQIIPVKEQDLLIAFCFPPYSSGTIKAARYAKTKNVPVISITDKLTAPIVEYSDVSLQAKTENRLFANSLSAINVIIYSLATATALKNREHSRQALAELARARSEYQAMIEDDYIQANKKFY